MGCGAFSGGDVFCSPHKDNGGDDGGGDGPRKGSTSANARRMIDFSSQISDDGDSGAEGDGGGADGIGVEEGGCICRMCHVATSDLSPPPGDFILLGCDCKKDLSSAHRKCAKSGSEPKESGCEICKATATNVGVPDEDIKMALQMD